MKKHYYLLIVTTIYDGIEFTSHITLENAVHITIIQANNYAEKMIVHPFLGEEVDRVEINTITKKEYDVFKKYSI